MRLKPQNSQSLTLLSTPFFRNRTIPPIIVSTCLQIELRGSLGNKLLGAGRWRAKFLNQNWQQVFYFWLAQHSVLWAIGLVVIGSGARRLCSLCPVASLGS